MAIIPCENTIISSQTPDWLFFVGGQVQKGTPNRSDRFSQPVLQRLEMRSRRGKYLGLGTSRADSMSAWGLAFLRLQKRLVDCLLSSKQVSERNPKVAFTSGWPPPRPPQRRLPFLRQLQRRCQTWLSFKTTTERWGLRLLFEGIPRKTLCLWCPIVPFSSWGAHGTGGFKRHVCLSHGLVDLFRCFACPDLKIDLRLICLASKVGASGNQGNPVFQVNPRTVREPHGNTSPESVGQTQLSYSLHATHIPRRLNHLKLQGSDKGEAHLDLSRETGAQMGNLHFLAVRDTSHPQIAPSWKRRQ